MPHSLLHRTMMRLATPQRLKLMREVESRRTWSLERIRAYQDAGIRDLIEYCWRCVPFYRKHWQGAISGPQDVTAVAHLERLPVLTKDQWRTSLEELRTSDPAMQGEPARSGGSTGRPTLFRVTKYDQEFAWAQMYLAWRWAGFNPGDPFLIVGGESIGVGLGDRRVLRDWIVNRWITSGSNLTPERARQLAVAPHFQKIRFIYGYPNAIRELAEMLAELGARPPRLRGVVCTAEVMRPEIRARIATLFGGVPVHDQWGMNDGGLFAAEGPDRDGLHVFFQRGILEVVDAANRQITELNRPGRALGTCLTNRATPFVRYETGDEVHWRSFEPAPSGTTWPRIGPVDGRTGDVIHLPGGKRIAMPGLTLVMRWLDGVRQYQFIQTGERSITARLEPDTGCALSEEEILAYLKQKIGAEIDWQLIWGKPELTRNGKILIIRNDWLRARAAGSAETTR